MLSSSVTIAPDEYLILVANSYDRRRLITENLFKKEIFNREKKQGLYQIQANFSIADPDERLDIIMGKIDDKNIKFDFEDPNSTPIHLKLKKKKSIPEKDQLEKIMIRALSKNKLAPNPYRKVTPTQSLIRNNSRYLISNSSVKYSISYKSKSPIKLKKQSLCIDSWIR
jgi:hypothetical protein